MSLAARRRESIRSSATHIGVLVAGGAVLGVGVAHTELPYLSQLTPKLIAGCALFLVYLIADRRAPQAFCAVWLVATVLASSATALSEPMKMGRFVAPVILAFLAFGMRSGPAVALRSFGTRTLMVVVLVGLSAIGSLDMGTTIFKGTALAIGLLGAAAAVRFSVEDPRSMRTAVAVALGAMAVSNVAFLGSFQGSRLRGWAINPNTLAELCALAIPVLVAEAMDRRGIGRSIAGSAAALSSLLLLLTGSRNGLIAVAIGMVALLRANGAIRRAAAAAVAAAVLAAIVAISFGSGTSTLTDEESLRLERVGEVSSGRLDRWSTGLDEIRKRPVFGAGYSTTAGRHFSWSSAANPEGGHFHNSYLEAGVEMGILGAALLLLYGLSALRFVVRPGPRYVSWAAGMAAAAAVLGAFETGLLTGGALIFVSFWLAIGTLWAAEQQAR